MLFGNVVTIPGRDLDDDFAGLSDLRLASETLVELQIGGHVEAIGFLVIHFGEEFFSFAHYDVASGAGAIAAARVVEPDAIVDGDIEDRLGLAVFFVWQLAVLEFNRSALGHKCDAHEVGAGCVGGCGGSTALIFSFV